MRKSVFFKCLFAVFVAMVLVSWAGSFFDNDEDAAFIPECQPAELLTGQPFGFLPIFTGYYKSSPHPLIPESSAGYLEMHEKSPPFAAFLF